MTQDKKGGSAMKLHRHLGISYNAAWRRRHKLMQVMMERDREHPLSGSIELDDAYFGGERSGGKRGPGPPGKMPFGAAVETNEQAHPLRMKLTVVEGFRLSEITAWAQQHLAAGTRVVSDRLDCFHGVTAAGCLHESVMVGSGRAVVERPEFRWVNMRIPVKPITESGVKPITESGQVDHLSERSDAGVRLCRSMIGLGQ